MREARSGPEGPRADEPRKGERAPGRATTSSWPWALAAVLVVALVVGAGWAVFRTLAGLPGRAVDRTERILRDLSSVASAFRRETAQTAFLGYATSLSGSNRLQVATLEEVQVFRRTESASVLWGALDLPDVVVEARAPVETTYFVDLKGAWRFTVEGRTLSVVAPPIRFNRPSIDVSALEIDTRQGSLLRDEEAARERLRKALTALAAARARRNLAQVRDTGRREVATFVETWLGNTFLDGGTYSVEVRFADEQSEPGLLSPSEYRR